MHQENTCKLCFQSNLIFVSDFCKFIVNVDKLQNKSSFKISAKPRVSDFGQNLKMTKNSKFCSIYRENIYKSCLQWNLIIFTDFCSFSVNEDKLQNESIFKITAKVRVCDFGQNLKMTKDS